MDDAQQKYNEALEAFYKQYPQASEDAVIAACTTYMAITGSVDTKAMEEAVKQAIRVNSYKQSDIYLGKMVSLCGVEGIVDRVDEKGFYWIGEYDFSSESMKKATIISTQQSETKDFNIGYNITRRTPSAGEKIIDEPSQNRDFKVLSSPFTPRCYQEDCGEAIGLNQKYCQKHSSKT